jgi:hypothetical protein
LSKIAYKLGQPEAFLGRREGEDVGRCDWGGKLVVGDRAEHCRLEAEAGCPGLPLGAVVEECLAVGETRCRPGSSRRASAYTSSRSSEPLRGSMPPTASTHRLRRALASARTAKGSSPAVAAKRCAWTPLGMMVALIPAAAQLPCDRGGHADAQVSRLTVRDSGNVDLR